MALEIPCPGCKAILRVREEHAGKQLKCPRCAAVLRVPAADEEPPLAVRPVARAVPPPAPLADEDATEQIQVDPPPVVAARRRCPRCGETIAASATRCRYCRAWLDEEDEEQERRPRQRHQSLKPCPRCGAGGPERVTWTPWGSFYGPALFTHVRCRECGYGYNGKTGGSNLVPAIFMVAIPAILIIAIVVGLLFVLGIFGGGRR
jgi:ribosomal protein S27E